MAEFNVNIGTEELQKSAVKYRKELLVMPVQGAAKTLMHMRGMPGVRGREIIGEMSGTIEMGPYDPHRVDEGDVIITPRTIETFLGSVVKKFDPNKIWQSIYGSLVTQGDALKNVPITRQVMSFLALKLGESLGKHIWDAKRNDNGTTTVDLFNGFDTITSTEIAAKNISAAKGNYMMLTSAIDETNAVDVLKTINEKSDDSLQDVARKMYVTRDIYNAYLKDYQATVGATPYNREYKKTFVEGSNDLLELVPLSSKKGSKFIHISPKSNMVYAYGNGMADENMAVEKHHAFLLDFISTMYFGAQFETISPERLFIAQLYGTVNDAPANSAG